MTIKHQRATTRAHSRHSQQMQSGQQRAHYNAGHQKASQTKAEMVGEQQQDDGFIPLPIQTFLWRQTSPFVRPLLGKARDLAQIEQRDACKLFERIIITNNIWGQSPSLEEAIDSIDRWRLIRVSFPFVLQCTAALLNNKLIKDHNLNRLGGNESKMMYTLQWILMDASEECADSENEAKSKATSVALAASLLKPSELSLGQAKSDSSAELIEQVRANRQVSMSSTSICAQVQLDLQDQQAQQQQQLDQQQQLEEQPRLVGGTNLAAALVPLSQHQPLTSSNSFPNSYLLPISSIQMFVYYFAPMMDGLKHSDFLSSNQRLEIGTALWEPLFHYQLPDIHCLEARIKKATNGELAQPPTPSTKATAESKLNANNTIKQQQAPVSSHYERRHSSSVFSSSAHFGDVFLGEPAPSAALARPQPISGSSSASQRDSQPDQQSAPLTQLPNGQTEPAPNSTNPNYATYLDVAVLRCLFISNWQESGVHWALNYLANRFNENSYKSDKKLDSFEANLAQLSLEARLKRRSKSLSCVCDEDLRRSLTLKQECAKGEKSTKTRMSKTCHEQTSACSLTDDETKQNDHTSKSHEGQFLNVAGVDGGSEGEDPEAPPKSPLRRLSFSSSMQTLATQIRKTSKRAKKSSGGGQQSSESATTDGDAEQALNRAIRRSSSADELTSGQLALLGGRQQQQQQAQQPVIKIVETQADEERMEERQKSSAIKESKQQQQRKPMGSAGASEPTARQYLMQKLYARSLKRFERLTRSQTVPKNMHLVGLGPAALKNQPDESEPHEADFYVDESGRIDPLVVLKILHLVSQRENACSLRVCDCILSLMNRLHKIDILAGHAHRSQMSLAKLQRAVSLLPSRQLGQRSSKSASQQAELYSKPNKLVHRILIDIVFRLNKHLGCPNHCGIASTVDRHHQHQHRAQQQAGRQTFALSGGATDSAVALGSNNLRLKLRESLHSLCHHDKNTFTQYVQDILAERNLQQAMDILHSILGFCHSDYSSYLNHRKQQQQQASETPAAGSQAARFGHSATGTSTSAAAAAAVAKQDKPEAVEGVIVSSSLKQLVTSMSKESRVRENAALHADIRRLINFVRENYNHTFKSVVLSALIDCTKLLNQQQQQQQQQQTVKTKILSADRNSSRAATRPPELTRNSSEEESSATIGTSGPGEPAEFTAEQGRYEPAATTSELLDEGELSDGTLAQQARHTSLGSHGRPHSLGTSSSASVSARALATSIKQQQQQQQSSGISSLSKARKKLEQVFGGKQSDGEGGAGGKPGSASARFKTTAADDDDSVLSGAGQLADSTPNQSHSLTRAFGNENFGSPVHVDATQAQRILLTTGHSPASSSAQLGLMNIRIIKQNQLIYNTVKEGMSNFAFLMESCLPGDFLEPALLAALLDLKSPIAIRAAIFLECANFVHRCNRGQWPAWMRMNVAQQHRASNAGFLGASAGTASGLLSSKLRKSSSIQRTARNNTLMYRAAGRAFYAWAEAVGARLEELLQQEQEATGSAREHQQEQATISEEADNISVSSGQQAHFQQHQRASSAESLLTCDLDFLQPTINGDSSPFVLKMAASQLLFEVTTFLRETYRYLPPTIVQHQVAGTKAGDKMSSIYDVSRAVTANRRWSMALSSLGFGQLPATLGALSAGAQASACTLTPSGNTLRTSGTISEQPERRISFILHETKDEEQQEEGASAGHGGSENTAERRLSKCDSIGAGPQQQQQSQQESHREGSLNSADTQVEPLRKITSAAPGRHLSQSSASSAVAVAAATLLRSSGIIESQTHRRKSIKLRKSVKESGGGGGDKDRKQTKFAQDFDEELENSSQADSAGLRRTDSSRSRRRVSGISERSDTSDQRPPQNGGQQQQQQQPDLSGNESTGNGSCEEAAPGATGATCAAANVAGGPASGGYPTASDLNKFEADESKIMSDMPWFKAVSLINSSIDCNCVHFPTCRSSCYKLHQNMCKRLVSFVQTIYQDPTEQSYLANLLERPLANLGVDSSAKAGRNRDDSQSGDTSSKGKAAAFRAASECAANQAEQPEGRRKKEKKSKGQKGRGLASVDSSSLTATQLEDGASLKASAGSKHKSHQPVAKTSQLDANTMASTLRASKAKERLPDEPAMIKYLRLNVKTLLHCPMSAFLKGAIILPRESFVEMIKFSWSLLLEDDQQLSRTAAVCFIVSAIKCPADASKLLLDELESGDASRKIAAINKFYVVWDARYQCWPRLEDGAFVHFKMAPPSIEFTLPSPKIAQESSPIVDPPWMPRKTSNVEEVTIGQDQTVQKSFVTATKTRRKQQIEIVTKALREKYDKLREDREKYHITSVPVTLYAAFEPTFGGGGQAAGAADELDGPAGSGGGAGGSGGAGSGAGGSAAGGPLMGDDDGQENRALFQMKTAQALFPTCLCQSAIVMINLLDDPRVTFEGSAVYEIASRVIWSCLVEDPALFLRYFFERLTRQNQSTIFQVLRRLIRFMPRLPPQAAYTLYNYLIGFIIYYIRCPFENSQKLIADTLSVLCLVVPSVHGLFLKDLKQILRKEQCDHNLLITANVPSAKKIIIHGSDSSGIPSQFPIDESTQFYHILVDSLEFFGIEKAKQNEYFLIDVRTNLMHNLHSYVRDHYSFRRSQHPQLQLINMEPSKAFDILQRQELINQFMEFGKVLMSLSIVKSSHMAVQRALFLHEELMKLPTFPRKALETNFSLFRGPLGHQVFSMDRIHKICWVRVIARMFELTSGFFLQLGDIQLFLNAISGIFVLHCEEASVLRLCLATFINATHQFKSIFATDGFMPIMATVVQVYSNHQNNQLLCRSIEFVCKQFYIMHRKPFLLQLFGSVASKLNTAEMLQQNQISSPIGLHHQHFQQPLASLGAAQSAASSQSASGSTSGGAGGPGAASPLHDPNRISPSAFFRLLLSLEKAFKDPLDILELVEAEKPLRAVDFCYQQDKESIEILDIISLCVTVTAYASESARSTQMLIILESVVPLYMKHLQTMGTKKTGQPMSKQAHKDELQKIQNISICIRTLIVNCEGLTRNFSGPLPSIDFRSSSIRRPGPSGSKQRQQQQQQQQQQHQNNSAGSPMDIYADEPSYTGPELKPSKAAAKREREAAQLAAGSKQTTFAKTNKQSNFNSEESEITRGEFIVPRDTLLNLVAEFLALSTGRLVESAKKYVELHQKHSSYELLDVKSHLRLAEVANSLLKFASTDPSVMACRGLIRYMKEILPNTEWRQEAIRPALIMILKRLDKTFNRIAKKNWVKKSTDWEAAKQLLKGAYLTFIKHPYIVHLPHLKSLISCCQNIVLSDGLQSAQMSSNLLHGFASAAAAAAAAAAASAASNVSQQQQLALGGPIQSSSSTVRLQQSQPTGSNLLSIANQPTAASGRQKTSASSSPSSSSHHLATLAAAAANVSTAAATGHQVAPLSQATLTSATGTNTSFAAVTAAAALAERLAAGSSSLSSSSAAQGFNSVTVRLIAMQLLQTGDSQTLESLIGNSMNTAEKLESMMLNLVYPMCIRVCSGAREAPKLRLCDIMYILNSVLQMLAPQSASSKTCASQANSPKAAADNASQFILSKITTTIGSTQTGATALGIVGGSSSHAAASAHQLVQHQEALKIGFLGLKIVCVCFEAQLASEWIRIARLIRDLSLQVGQPSAPLWDFLAFVATYRFPMFILLLPTIRCNIAKKVREERHTGAPNEPGVAHYEQCLRMIEAKICGSAPSVCRSRSFLFVSLTAELRMLKEQLIAKRRQLAEGERQTATGGPPNASSSSASSQQHASGQACAGAGAGAAPAASGLGNTPASATSSGALSAEPADHFGTAYHRLSQAIASFANQSGASGQAKLSGSGPGAPASKSASSGVSAIKNACFAAQLATSAPIGPQISEVFAASGCKAGSGEQSPAAASIRLSTAKSREEARKVMNTILRRTSYPHNQSTATLSASGSGAQQEALAEGSPTAGSGLRKASHPEPSSPSIQPTTGRRQESDLEAGRSQLIMNPAMLMAAAFPAPRKSNLDGSGILKQLVHTIDRQNNQRQQQLPPAAKWVQAGQEEWLNEQTGAQVQQGQRSSVSSASGQQQKSRRISIQSRGVPAAPPSHHHQQQEADIEREPKKE